MSDLPRCLCGCGRQVKRKGRKYFYQGCVPRSAMQAERRRLATVKRQLARYGVWYRQILPERVWLDHGEKLLRLAAFLEKRGYGHGWKCVMQQWKRDEIARRVPPRRDGER